MIESLSRRHLLGIIALPLLPTLSACAAQRRDPSLARASSAAPTPYEASRQRMQAKFGDMGVELRVDAFKGQKFYGVEFFPAGSDRSFYASSVQSLTNRSNLLMPLSIPERVRVLWRESSNKPVSGKSGLTSYDDRIIGRDTIEVGSRIPQEVLDSIRRERGQLRLKFRLTNDGVYFGWDISRRPGYDPKRLDAYGNPVHVSAVHSMAGGDFREAEIVNGQAVRNGWYIDKKTGQKIETDF